MSVLERARAFLDRVPLVDGHNDLPFVIRADKEARGDVAAFHLEERRDGRDTDIPRLIEGKVAAQFWAAFVPPREKQPASFA
ncbi:MAG: rane dipeptidase, partial [Methylobacteriaceae bacterium]|nr:rane dipeptidase [Methylobacteriaceae bacterium]